ncbi:MAG: mammalian cell entry protein [Mycobacterium sp.]|jgi:Mce-associated membrane protein|nr:mammalian cell entry protein [Mycobacterium sp.]MDT5176435.1 Mce-associated rane protein [Mycobacterium sp.]
MSRWSSRLVSRSITVVGIVFAAAFIALGGIGGSLYWNRVERVGEQEAKAELPALAAQQIPVILGFDYQTIERSRTAAYQLLTPDFRREYEEDTTKNVIPAARDRQIVSQVNVVGVGMLDAHRDSGSVMVYMNRVLTDKTKQPLYDGSRLRVDYEKVGQDWRIKDITPI